MSLFMNQMAYFNMRSKKQTSTGWYIPNIVSKQFKSNQELKERKPVM